MKTVTFLIATKLAILLACRMWGAEPPAVTLGFRTTADMSAFTVRSTQTNLIAVVQGEGAFNFVPGAGVPDAIYVLPASGVVGTWRRSTVYQSTNSVNLTPLAASTPAASKVWKTDGAGVPDWRDDVGGVANTVVGPGAPVVAGRLVTWSGTTGTNAADSGYGPITGTPDGSKFMRDDWSWQTPPSGVPVTGMGVVNTISDLVAYAGTGTNLVVLGRNSVNDGGGGIFYSVSGALPGASTNLGTAFNATGKYWLRVMSQPVLPEWFGAIPNDGVDDTTALQAAIDYATKLATYGSVTPTACELRLPRGRLNINAGLVVTLPSANYGITIKGYGRTVSMIYTANAGIDMLTVGTDGVGGNGLTMSDFHLAGGSNGWTDAANLSQGLVLHDIFSGAIERITASQLHCGFYLDDGLNGSGAVGELWAKDCEIGGILRAHQVSMLGLRAEACKTGWIANIGMNTIDLLSQNNLTGMILESCYEGRLRAHFEHNATNLLVGISTNGVVTRGTVNNLTVFNSNLSAPTNVNVWVYTADDIKWDQCEFDGASPQTPVGSSVTNMAMNSINQTYINTSERYPYRPILDGSHGMSKVRNAFPDGGCEYGYNVWATTVNFASGTATMQSGGRNNSICVKMATTSDLDSPLCSFICTPAAHKSLLNKTVAWSMWVYVDSAMIAAGATPRIQITDGVVSWFPTVETATLAEGWNYLFAGVGKQVTGTYLYLYFYFDYNNPGVTVPSGAYLIVDDIVAQEWPGDLDKAANGDWYQDESWEVAADARWFGSGTPPFSVSYTGIQLTQNQTNALLQTIKGGAGTNLTLQLGSSAGTVWTGDEVGIGNAAPGAMLDIGPAPDGTNAVRINGGVQTGSSRPALEVSQTWNNAATAFKGVRMIVANAASNGNSTQISVENGSGDTICSVVPGVAASSAPSMATGQVLIPNGTATRPGLAFGSDNDGSGTGLFLSGANSMCVAFNGTRTLDFYAGLTFSGGLGSTMVLNAVPIRFGVWNAEPVLASDGTMLQLGADGATPTAAIFKGPDGSGSDRTGGALYLAGGNGTGTGPGGSVRIRTTPPATSTGSSQNTPVDRFIAVAYPITSPMGATTSVVLLGLGSTNFTGGEISYSISCRHSGGAGATNGIQVGSGNLKYTAGAFNIGGVTNYVVNLTDLTNAAVNLGDSTFGWTWTALTNYIGSPQGFYLQLTPTNTVANRATVETATCTYAVINNAEQLVTPQ